MPPIYLVGGDTYQKLDYPIEAGQTFRVDQPFALHWIDLNLKLSGKKPEAIVQLYHADAFHLPSGDPISISRHWLINPPFAPTDWFWHEPWGKTLTENNPWTFLNPPPNITYQILNGVITLTNYGHMDIGISYSPLVSFPLIHEDSRQLHLALNCPYVTTVNYATIIGLGGYFHHPVDGVMHFAFYIALGAAWYDGGQYGVEPAPPWPRGWKYIGVGSHHINLYDYWLQWRTDLGLPLDPTDWTMSNCHLAMIQSVPSAIDRLQNDYIGCYYPSTPGAPPPSPSTGFTWPNRLYRVRFSMQEVLLSPDQYYFIRVTAFPGLLEGAHHWQYDKADATYLQGIRLATNDGGLNWTKHFADDHLFAAFGTPPAPPPPPDPPLPNWCVLLVTQTRTATGYKITCWTNVPCHLYFFWTDTEPEKHKKTRIVRGLTVPDAPAYCFVTWHQNEQEEAGDTIYHTFIKEPWPECETRWYTFRALVNNEWTTSAAPIFKKHRPVLVYGAPQWIECPVVLPTFMLTAADEPWPDVLTADPDYEYKINSIGIIHYRYGDLYAIRRCGLTYDTSLLPVGSIILSAKIKLYDKTSTWWNPLSGNYWVNLVDGNLWDGTDDWGWYAIWNAYRDVCAEYYVPAQMSPLCRVYPLTALGLEQIVPEGLTRYIARLKDDVDQVPGTGTLTHYVAGLDHGGCESILYIEYQPPL